MRSLFILLVLLVLINVQIECGRGGRGGRGRISGSKSRSRSRTSWAGRSSYGRRGLSSGKLKYLFPTAGALAGIYIASQMRPRVRLHSYRDLDRYTVCEGPRIVYENGTKKSYGHFLCPDNPIDRTLIYCCQSNTNGQYCCNSYRSPGSRSAYIGRIVGGLFGFLIVMGIVGVFVYICCRRKRTVSEPPPSVIHSTMPQPTEPKPDAFVLPPGPGVAPYPMGGSTDPYPMGGPTNPYPMSEPTNAYPAAPYPTNPYPASSTAIGSGWSTAPHQPSTVVETPPPPYPGYAPAPVFPTAPSAP